MQFDILKVTLPLDLGGYAEPYKGRTVQVWVNPDLGTLRRRELLIEKYNRMLSALAQTPEVTDRNRKKVAEQVAAQLEEFNRYALGEFLDGINKWFAELWSQGSDPATHWTVEELVSLNEKDPALFQWMKNASVEMLARHRDREKKV